MILNENIIRQIKAKSGLLLEQAKDFSVLAGKIFSETGRNIGVTTLKRLLGTINDSRKTNEYTLNTIALYLGYSRVSGGSFTLPSLGTVLDSLPSHGSSHLTLLF